MFYLRQALQNINNAFCLLNKQTEGGRPKRRPQVIVHFWNVRGDSFGGAGPALPALPHGFSSLGPSGPAPRRRRQAVQYN